MQNGTKNPPDPDPDPLELLPNPATPQPHQHTQSGMPRTGAILKICLSAKRPLLTSTCLQNNLKQY